MGYFLDEPKASCNPSTTLNALIIHILKEPMYNRSDDDLKILITFIKKTPFFTQNEFGISILKEMARHMEFQTFQANSIVFDYGKTSE
jgi:hypothetical protein